MYIYLLQKYAIHAEWFVTVCLKCRCPSGFLYQDVRTHNSSPPWTSLAESSGENPVSFTCSDVSLPQRSVELTQTTIRCLNGTAPPYLADTIQPTTDVDGRRCLRSGAAPTLVSPTRRSTLGDRAFPAVATRAWNALPSSVRTIPSLMSFRRELKSTLFNISLSGSDM